MCLKFVCLKIIYLQILFSPSHGYFVLGNDGAYKYGYKSDDGTVVRQEADPTNQVSGHYFYRHDLGNFGIRYTSGVQGYRPEGVDPKNLLYLEYPYPQGVYSSHTNARSPNTLYTNPPSSSYISGRIDSQFQANKRYGNINFPIINNFEMPDGTSYKFSFDAGNYKREETSDSRGNVRGYFSYVTDDGVHDLSYVANDRDGFKVTGGNLVYNLAYPVEPRRFTYNSNVYGAGPDAEASENIPKIRQPNIPDVVENNSEVPFLEGVTTTRAE